MGTEGWEQLRIVQSPEVIAEKVVFILQSICVVNIHNKITRAIVHPFEDGDSKIHSGTDGQIISNVYSL